jgi:hypothetical protein
VAAGSHHLLPSLDHHPWHPCGMASKNLEMCRGVCLVVDTVTTLAWSADPDGSVTSLINVVRTYRRDLSAAIPKGIRHRSLP